ncbi:DUF3015 family protein [Oligoflexus tunisiensis]|uniref:DUF3015 family protein n=1 Tax=Oligoflexus tunisiensis TaxID=708132 RepID=UPI00114D37C0|nr:DUF3015 family protein [Oligoflexus tunisiensis]
MKHILVGSCLVLFATGLMAAEKGPKYGMAGCGLGALVIDRNELLPQVGAWFLNGIASNQTYGMTSGTSNCVQGRSDVAAMEQEVYMTANLSSLSKEAAQGSGEHLNALAEVLGCQEEDKVRLGELSQNHYSELFANQEPEAVLQRYLTVVNADPQLAKSCTKAG